MVTAHSAPNFSARSRVVNSIARLCMLAGFPVWAAARLAARLVLPLRFRRPRRTSIRRSSSARCGAFPATHDRTQVRSLLASTSPASQPFRAEQRVRVVRLPDVAWPITHHEQKKSYPEPGRGVIARTRRSSTTFSHRRVAAEESPRSPLTADPHEARNSYQREPARDAGRNHRGRPARRATRRPPRSPADGWRHLPR